MKYISLLVLLLFCTPTLVGTAALADKMYTQEEASNICTSSINTMLIDLDALVKEGYNTEQLKAAVRTKDIQIKALTQLFIEQVMNKQAEAASVTLLKTHRLCTTKLSNVEV